jgi:hypothetical protein
MLDDSQQTSFTKQTEQSAMQANKRRFFPAKENGGREWYSSFGFSDVTEV